MGFRYRKSKSFGPLRLTASRRGMSCSVGVKGFRISRHANGTITETASLPGTGISYTKTLGKRRHRAVKPHRPGLIFSLVVLLTALVRKLFRV